MQNKNGSLHKVFMNQEFEISCLSSLILSDLIKVDKQDFLFKQLKAEVM